jgi:hypothetical protein
MAKRLLDQDIKVTAERIGVMVRDCYPAEQYAMFYEVRDGTGFHASRSCDALVISLWPSRGLEISGFEFKVSRQDWVKELANPAKAEAIAAYCDRWWLCVSNTGIVQPGELPPTWGLMDASGDSLKVVKEAEKLKPIELDRLFVAAIARSAQKHSPGAAAIAAAVKAARDEWEKRERKDESYRAQRDSEEINRLKRSIEEFEAASGIRISSWDAPKIGQAVKLILNRKIGLAEDVSHAAAQLERVTKALRELEALPALLKPIVGEPGPVASEPSLL